MQSFVISLYNLDSLFLGQKRAKRANLAPNQESSPKRNLLEIKSPKWGKKCPICPNSKLI
jgi:hypothetical protein